jgi:hypothetical protein
MSATEHGIHRLASDEKMLVANINRFLAAQGYRKLYKREPTGSRDPEHPGAEPRYRHFYCQFLKLHPRWYFDLYPNLDQDGRARFPRHPQAGWTLYANKVSPQWNSVEDDARLDAFFRALLDATGFATDLLHAYAENENRR